MGGKKSTHVDFTFPWSDERFGRAHITSLVSSVTQGPIL